MREGLKITLVLPSIIFLSQICWIQGQKVFLAHYSSKYDELCNDECSKRGGDYYYCNTDKGRDYCSLAVNTDYKGTACRVDHPCEKHGRDYYWCRNNAGGSENCGKVMAKKLLHFSSTYGRLCHDECSYDDEEYYYWCNTQDGWDYCSPTPDVTYQNEPCRSGHKCGSYFESYTWCYTDSSWDYCGLVRSTKLTYTSITRKKRQAESFSNNEVEICKHYDEANKKLTTFYAVTKPTDISDGNHWKKEIEIIISRWNNSHLQNQAKSELITVDILCIDIQGTVPRNNQQYYNLQIQLNVPRPPGGRTTVAQVLLPQNEDVPDRFVRRAFTESFKRRTKVFVDVRHSIFFVKQKKNNNCD